MSARYTVKHAYASNHNGRQFGPWTAGDEVELDVPDAEWINRDSPGALEDATAKRQQAKRSARGGKDGA